MEIVNYSIINKQHVWANSHVVQKNTKVIWPERQSEED